jgi:hypothetical protein
MAMVARDGDEVIMDAVRGRPPTSRCSDVRAAAPPSVTPPGTDRGVNLPADLLASTLDHTIPLGPTRSPGMGRLGLQPTGRDPDRGHRHDESAWPLLVVDLGISHHVHSRVLTVADTDYGRISMTPRWPPTAGRG